MIRDDSNRRDDFTTDDNVTKGGQTERTSTSLLRRARINDPLAWERIVRLYGPMVMHWCRRRGLADEDAADVGQEVFRAVIRKLADFEHRKDRPSFRGWLRRITVNKVIDLLRANGRQPKAWGNGDEQPLEPAVEAPTSAELSEEQALLYQRAAQLVRNEFSDAHYQAFYQVVVEGKSVREVAVGLGLSENAVYLAKSRILRRLRDEFADILVS